MVNTVNIVEEFSAGGEVVFNFSAKNRTGSTLDSSGSPAASIVVRDIFTGLLIFEEKTAPEITIIDVGNSKWQVKPSAANLLLVEAGKSYDYDIWTVTDVDGRLHQFTGLFRLKNALVETP